MVATARVGDSCYAVLVACEASRQSHLVQVPDVHGLVFAACSELLIAEENNARYIAHVALERTENVLFSFLGNLRSQQQHLTVRTSARKHLSVARVGQIADRASSLEAADRLLEISLVHVVDVNFR